MDDGIILLVVVIIVSLPVVGMMLLFTVLWIRDKEEILKRSSKEG